MAMNKKFKQLISCIVLLVLLAQSIWWASDILKPVFIGDVYNAVDAFYEQPDNSIDVIVYGSSHAWKGFDTAELSKNYGVNAWNYGGNWQRINTSALFLEDSLLSQSPKVVLIDSFLVNAVHENTSLNGEIMYTNHLRWSDAKIRYIKQVFGNQIEEYFAYFMPLVYFHANWNSLNKWNFVNPTDEYDFEASKGYYSSSDIVPITIPDYTTFNQTPLHSQAKETLDRIVKTCKDRGIEVVFYVAPWDGEYTHRDAMLTYAAENGCYFVDFFEKAEEAGICGETDFQDHGHLNDSGSKKIANYMGQYLFENLGIGNPTELTTN